VDRGLSSFKAEDFQRIELSMESEEANARMREGTEACRRRNAEDEWRELSC
jgi:hypothetical protein